MIDVPPEPELPDWLRPPVLKVPLAQAQAQLASFIAAGHRLRTEALRSGDFMAFDQRTGQWRHHSRRWLTENLGGQPADEFETLTYSNAGALGILETPLMLGASAFTQQDRGIRRSNWIASETRVLESIAQRLPEWFPPGDTTSPVPSPAAPDAVAARSAARARVQPNDGQDMAPTIDPRAVMVIYGHDIDANNALFDWLRRIGLKPLEFSQLVQATGTATPYTGDAVRKAFDVAQAVIAFFTPDERVRERWSLSERNHAWRLQARPNVLIEAGMALVTHPDRTVLVLLGPQELPSDLAGRHYIRLDHNDARPLHDLATRLHKVAGCETDITGTSWLDPHLFPDRSDVPSAPRSSS